MLTSKTIFNVIRWWFFPKKNPLPNLGLHGDLDDIDMIEGVEKTFDIQFSNQQVETMRTVGDFFDVACGLVSQNGGELEWIDFTIEIAPYGTMQAAMITRETTFFSYIYGQDK